MADEFGAAADAAQQDLEVVVPPDREYGIIDVTASRRTCEHGRTGEHSVGPNLQCRGPYDVPPPRVIRGGFVDKDQVAERLLEVATAPVEPDHYLAGMAATFATGDRRTATAYQRLVAQVMGRPGSEKERLEWAHWVMGEAQRRCEALGWDPATALESVMADVLARRL